MVSGFLYNNVLAEQLASDCKIKDFGLFILLKAKYTTGRYKNWSIKSISEKTGFSRQLLKKSIKLFFDYGWVAEDGPDLVFKPFKTFDNNREKELVTIKIEQGDGVKQIVSKLRFAIIKSRNDKFQFLKRVKSDYTRSPFSPEFKRAKRHLKKLDLKKLPNAEQNYTVSIAKIAKMFGCSSATACKEMQRYKKNGDVLCISGFSRHFNSVVNSKMTKAALATISGTFLLDGIVYIIQCNQYVF